MLIGHQKQRDFLRKISQSNRLAHAYLFSGLEKIGKKTAAFDWAFFLLDNKDYNGDFIKRKHPDLIFIEPKTKESSSGKREIQVSQIRDLIWRFSLKPSLASLKIVIIDNAHLMNQEAQSCLLKTLEEPKGQALLILITDKKQYLFSTILSRVQIVKFNPVSEQEIKQCLLGKNISQENVERIFRIASGRPGVALDLVSDEKNLERFSQTIAQLSKMFNSPLYFRFQHAKDLSESSLVLVQETLDIWLAHLRAVLLSRALPSFSQNNSAFNSCSTIKLKKIIDQIQTLKFLLSSTNVNTRLALEALMAAI